MGVTVFTFLQKNGLDMKPKDKFTLCDASDDDDGAIDNDNMGYNDEDELPPFPPVFPLHSAPLRPKEAVLIILALLLLVCSILLFYRHWKKNYRDINQLPYYAYLYQKVRPRNSCTSESCFSFLRENHLIVVFPT